MGAFGRESLENAAGRAASVVERLVICAAVNDECPKECIHAVEHKPIWDNYRDDNDGMYCIDDESECGYRDDEPMCQCR